MDTRMLVLARDRYRCVRCGRPLENHWSGYSIHHRRFRSHPWPGLNRPSNLICLCGSGTTECHSWVHANRVESERNGWVVSGFNDHPETIPVLVGREWMLLDDMGVRTPCASQLH